MVEQPAHAFLQGALLPVRRLLGRAEVVAAGEVLAGAEERDDVHVAVPPGIREGVVERLEQAPALRVAVARPVDRDARDMVGDFVENVAHVGEFVGRATRWASAAAWRSGSLVDGNAITA